MMLGVDCCKSGSITFVIVSWPPNSVPSPGRAGTGPMSCRPFHTVTWLAVRTGLPTAASSSSMIASVCIAVSGTSTASASGWSAAVTIATTCASSSVPTSAAVKIPWLPIDTTSTPPAERNRTKCWATSSGYDAATATRRNPRCRTASTKAIEVDDAGTPAAAATPDACSRAPSGPKTKLPDVHAHITASGFSAASCAAPSASRSARPRSSSASTRCASSPTEVITTGSRTVPPTRDSSAGKSSSAL